MEVINKISGSGYGDGSAGDGSGYGDGYGSGYGSGDSDGYGSGSGDGDGSGYGYGDGYWLEVFKTLAAPEYLDSKDSIVFWKSSKDGFASNGGSSQTAAKPGLKENAKGPLSICTINALHGTIDPTQYSGESLWIVALKGEVQWKDDKTAALEREILMKVY